MTNIRIEVKTHQPYHVAIRHAIRMFTNQSGTILAEARRRRYFESKREEVKRKAQEERLADKRAKMRGQA